MASEHTTAAEAERKAFDLCQARDEWCAIVRVVPITFSAVLNHAALRVFARNEDASPIHPSGVIKV